MSEYQVYASRATQSNPMRSECHNLQWQTTPPTIPGWYWVMIDGVVSPEIIRCSTKHGYIVCSWGGVKGLFTPVDSGDVNGIRITAWLGPLPVPGAPE